MHFLDLTLETPAENVALDEALLEEAEAASEPRETLRLWEPRSLMVVIGRSSKPEAELQLDFCRQHHVPVLRRASGGAAIVTGPGCLMYALILNLELRPSLRPLDETHRFVLETIAAELNQRVSGVCRQGISDLALATSPFDAHRKISGNSVRIKRRHLLYHGTLLHSFPLDLIANCLALAPRQPAYRGGRDHNEFVENLPVDAGELRDAMIAAWEATIPRTDWPQLRVQQLVTGKYRSAEWTIEV